MPGSGYRKMLGYVGYSEKCLDLDSEECLDPDSATELPGSGYRKTPGSGYRFRESGSETLDNQESSNRNSKN
jgi:hypothetical protein